MSDHTQSRILVIGSLPPPLGGTSVSLHYLVSSLERREGVQLEVVNTNSIRGKGAGSLYHFVSVLKRICRKARNVDIITLHVSLLALPVIGPAVLMIAKLFKKPLLIRRFGGNDHRELKGVKFLLADLVVRKADIYLVQTLTLLSAMKDHYRGRVEWFPTSRPEFIRDESRVAERCSRFVFISHIRTSKGIPEIIEAAERFQSNIVVDIYGPFYDGLSEDIFSDCKNIRYCGIIGPDEVPLVLARHDALLLPTYYIGEGYPGIILEAFSAGLPVIASRWKAIPELVDETCGVLIPPKDSDALYGAMARLSQDRSLYDRLHQGATARHKKYDLNVWTERFVEYCKEAG